MYYWVLYGALVIKSINHTDISVYQPLIFKTEYKCLKIKELNESQNENKHLNCKKTKVEDK